MPVTALVAEGPLLLHALLSWVYLCSAAALRLTALAFQPLLLLHLSFAYPARHKAVCE